jgi:hypothetical protein
LIPRPGEKGFRLEELLRAYFLRAGFFVVRAVPFQHAGDDLTDIDLWLYERPTGSSRRRQIVDAKSKTKPKAVERLLWTKGLVQLLEVDGACVATTDSRSMLRGISRKLGIAVLDGADIQRISESDKVLYPDRITEEDFLGRLTAIDKQRRNKECQLQYHDLKHALIENFGAGTLNRALEAFAQLASMVVTAHPGTDAAEVAVRLAYVAAAFAALCLDYIGSEVSFRTLDERRSALSNAIRYGNIDRSAGLERMRLATALVEKYVPNGDAAARTLEIGLKKDLNNIPAEIIADYVVKNTRLDDLFQIARGLEYVAMSRVIADFDALETVHKAFIGVLLDYTGTDRSRFASSWVARFEGNRGKVAGDKEGAVDDTPNDGPLFSAGGLSDPS